MIQRAPLCVRSTLLCQHFESLSVGSLALESLNESLRHARDGRNPRTESFWKLNRILYMYSSP